METKDNPDFISYMKHEHDFQIIKMKALGIDTNPENQSFEQMVNTVIYLAGGMKEGDLKSFSEWVEGWDFYVAGDGYDALSDNSKLIIDSAIKKYIEWLKPIHKSEHTTSELITAYIHEIDSLRETNRKLKEKFAALKPIEDVKERFMKILQDFLGQKILWSRLDELANDLAQAVQIKVEYVSDSDLQIMAADVFKMEKGDSRDEQIIKGGFREAWIMGRKSKASLTKQGSAVEGWIRVEDKPLVSYCSGQDYEGKQHKIWQVNEGVPDEFLAAIEVHISTNNKTYWWIRHCVIEDEVGLCIVGDDSENISAGWEISDVQFYQPLPKPPKQ